MIAKFCQTPSLRFQILIVFSILFLQTNGKTHLITEEWSRMVYPSTFSTPVEPGDTIKIANTRTKGLKFFNLTGSSEAPIVITNHLGQVSIDDNELWGALTFVDCRYIKVSGRGVDSVRYGFRLKAQTAGVTFTEYSSDCELEFVEIHHSGFFGVYAKKDFGGQPPVPYPQFNNLIIHDNYIHHCTEGMYIGETKSPGMELRHVRIYNNVVTDCGREAIQLANCPEDVEVYNNFCMNTGLDSTQYQQGCFQIGDNTVGRYYNNIFGNCPENGILVMGSGDIEIYNNYVSNTSGSFIDNRLFSNKPASISIYNNYYREVHGNEVIWSMNEVNEIHLTNNKYNGVTTFAKNDATGVPVWEELGNEYVAIPALQAVVTDGVFTRLAGNPAEYAQMGPVEGLSHVANSTPVFDTLVAQYIEFGDTLNYTLHATTADQDFVRFEIRGLPQFITANQSVNGDLTFTGVSVPQHKGVYFITILVHDSSHRAYARARLKIAYKDPANINPVLSVDPFYTMEAASQKAVPVVLNSNDTDSVYFTFTGLPAFVTATPYFNSAILALNPLLADCGTYPIAIVADDGYGHPDTATTTLEITEAVLDSLRLLYRVNYGGPELPDQLLNWQSDKEREPAYGTDLPLGTGSHSWKGTNNTGAPDNLFGPYRHCNNSSDVFNFAYPIPTNGLYRVSLYFAERTYEVTNNLTGTFNVALEDTTLINNFNIYNEFGYEAVKKSFDVMVFDQRIDVRLEKLVNDAKLNGIEITYLSSANNPPVVPHFNSIETEEGVTDTLQISFADDNFPGCTTFDAQLVNAPSFLTLAQYGTQLLLITSPGFEDAGVYNNCILTIDDGCQMAVDTFNLVVADVFQNTPPMLNTPDTITLNEGETISVTIEGSDPDNQPLTFFFDPMPTFCQFIYTDNNSGRLDIAPGYSDSGVYELVVSTTDPYQATSTDTMKIFVNQSNEITRIPLTSDMITDLVRPPYGSQTPPALLVDEQSLDPMQNQHPVSANWKPHYNNSYAPYHFYIDLGQEYVIKKVFIHDMHSVADLTFSYGEPDNWEDWFVEPCNAYNKWKLHETNITTRYIRVSQINTIWAQANEIAIYGYADSSKNSTIEKLEPSYFFYPNPARNYVTLGGKPGQIRIDITDLSGKTVLRTNSRCFSVNHLKKGIYQALIQPTESNSGEVLKLIVQ